MFGWWHRCHGIGRRHHNRRQRCFIHRQRWSHIIRKQHIYTQKTSAAGGDVTLSSTGLGAGITGLKIVTSGDTADSGAVQLDTTGALTLSEIDTSVSGANGTGGLVNIGSVDKPSSVAITGGISTSGSGTGNGGSIIINADYTSGTISLGDVDASGGLIGGNGCCVSFDAGGLVNGRLHNHPRIWAEQLAMFWWVKPRRSSSFKATGAISANSIDGLATVGGGGLVSIKAGSIEVNGLIDSSISLV